ncbi:MAG TPA: hypothetical protein VM324_06600 [Egibacteraceae bacterium]|nr:hypothetical protein [Egibacteraceae bacterium]
MGGDTAEEPRDEVLEALDELVAALRDSTKANEQALKRADQIRRARNRGATYGEIVSGDDEPLIVHVTRANLNRLLEAASRFQRAQARALHAEGFTMERIGEIFGVTRQRVSALLRSRRR